MTSTTVVYIIIIAFLAFAVAAIQYLYKAKTTTKSKFVFAFLRFLSLFILGLLLVNPKIKKKTITNVKPNLVVAVDNSSSVSFLKEQERVKAFLSALGKSQLSEQFNIDYYSFGSSITPLLQEVDFTEKQTNLSKVFSTLKEVYKETSAPTILITDGNQTFGQDYVVSALSYKQPIYSVVVGDSIQKPDIQITDIHHNKYSFLGNEFPVEITVQYNGEKEVSQLLTLVKGNSVIHTKQITFNTDTTTQVLEFNLPATQIGKQKYSVRVAPLTNEDNVSNNTRNFSVQVIDERTNVLIVSAINHPDIGMFKKAIESNKQRKVTIVKPTEIVDYNEYQLLIIYQPTIAFKQVYTELDKFDKNYITVVGLQTDWNFLNSIQNTFKRQVINQSQEYLASVNSNFNLFQVPELQINTYPPLVDIYGTTVFDTSAFSLLTQNINGIATNTPLLAFFERVGKREALLSGEGIWKWRAQSFLNTQSFEVFDAYLGRLVQYLAANTKKERLAVDVKDSFLLGEAKINTQFFDKNYVLNPDASVAAELTNTTLNKSYSYDFLFKKNSYELNLSSLPAGNYTYEVVANGIKKSGDFEIIDFDIEAQFVNPNITKLSQLTNNTNLYYLNQYEKLFTELKNNKNYKPIQKVILSTTPIIKWKVLLAILIGLLTFEWLLRKYKGLI